MPLDLKKTRFKKISTFLKEMESVQKCIKLKDQKGVLSITSVVNDSPFFTFYKRPDWMRDAVTGEVIRELKPEDLKFVFEIFEVYRIDGNSEGLFYPSYKKNDVVTAAEIRQFITNHIKENQLQLKEEPKYFVVNEKLAKAFLKKTDVEEKMSFETLWTTVFQKLSPMHQIKRVFKDKKLEDNSFMLRKGKYQPVEFKLENRGGNKKVTSIHNLATFELDFQQLQQRLRKEIGCSVSLVELENPSAGASMYQVKEHIVSVQGNQITPIADLLKCKRLSF